MAKRRYSRSGAVRWLDYERCAHREDGPAVVYADGTQYWYRRGRSHFAHGPADLWSRGTIVWFEDCQFLRGRKPYG